MAKYIFSNMWYSYHTIAVSQWGEHLYLWNVGRTQCHHLLGKHVLLIAVQYTERHVNKHVNDPSRRHAHFSWGVKDMMGSTISPAVVPICWNRSYISGVHTIRIGHVPTAWRRFFPSKSMAKIKTLNKYLGLWTGANEMRPQHFLAENLFSTKPTKIDGLDDKNVLL